MPVVVKNGGGAPGAIGIKLDRDLWLFRQSTAKVLYDRHALPYDDVGVGDSGHSVEQDDVPRLPVDEGENHGGRGMGMAAATIAHHSDVSLAHFSSRPSPRNIAGESL